MKRLLMLALCAGNALALDPPSTDDKAFLMRQQNEALLAAKPNLQHPGQPWLHVSVQQQTLTFYDAQGLPQKSYAISTAKNGVGERVNSYQTPRGWHRVCERIGDNVEPDTIIYRRKVTPWKYTPQLHAENPEKDWILTRILWLCGSEPGKNQGGEVDSYDRAIYIHGAGQHVPFGTPTSRGCVRMRNEDVIELYSNTQNGIDVLISEES